MRYISAAVAIVGAVVGIAGEAEEGTWGAATIHDGATPRRGIVTIHDGAPPRRGIVTIHDVRDSRLAPRSQDFPRLLDKSALR
jgi:hypothetical protein